MENQKPTSQKKNDPSTSHPTADRSENSNVQRHENRENPRADHKDGHLGYNKTHLDTNLSPVKEGSDKI